MKLKFGLCCINLEAKPAWIIDMTNSNQSQYWLPSLCHHCRFRKGSGATWLLDTRPWDHSVPSVCQGVQLERAQAPLPCMRSGGVCWLLGSMPPRAVSWLGSSGEGVRCLCHPVRLPVTPEITALKHKKRKVSDCARRLQCSTLAPYLKALTLNISQKMSLNATLRGWVNQQLVNDCPFILQTVGETIRCRFISCTFPKPPHVHRPTARALTFITLNTTGCSLVFIKNIQEDQGEQKFPLWTSCGGCGTL